MVRLVPTADPEILLFTPAVQLAEPTEPAPGKSVDPSKKKPATKKAIKESSTSLQRQTEPTFPIATDSLSFLLSSQNCCPGVQASTHPPRGHDGLKADLLQMGPISTPSLSSNSFLPPPPDSHLKHCTHGEILHCLFPFYQTTNNHHPGGYSKTAPRKDRKSAKLQKDHLSKGFCRI